MDIGKYKILTTETLIKPMLNSLEEWDELEYTKEDVQKLEQLINQYLDKLGLISKPSDDLIMNEVKNLVLALNALNESTDYALIETMEREAIWEVIQNSAIECGLTDASEDITEEWRDW